jgi:hypothetical protein
VKEKKIECLRHSNVVFKKRIVADEVIVALFAHSKSFVATTTTNRHTTMPRSLTQFKIHVAAVASLWE